MSIVGGVKEHLVKFLDGGLSVTYSDVSDAVDSNDWEHLCPFLQYKGKCC